MEKNQQQLKEEVAAAAVASLPDDLLIGVGTGSTVDCFIDALASSGKRIRAAVASSHRSAERMVRHGIRVVELSSLDEPLTVYVDGADEIEPGLAMIKGGGAALTREKIVASASEAFVCIVDESKLVDRLGRFPLPIEVIQMAIGPVTRALVAMGGRPVVREGVLTDNGHPIIDVHGLELDDPLAWEDRLNALPGVVTNGVFARQRASLALVAGQSGVRQIKASR
ncbi:MAG: ribose-5-phosphate isomerase RpiA [Pseudomonadota bacterium]|jgi:ribose 5-phosphate isomerase A